MSIKSKMGFFFFLTAVYTVDVMGTEGLQLLSCTLPICAVRICFHKGDREYVIPSKTSVWFPPGLPLSLFLPGPKEHTQQLTWAVPLFTVWDREERGVGHPGFGIPGAWRPGSGEDSGCTFPQAYSGGQWAAGEKEGQGEQQQEEKETPFAVPMAAEGTNEEPVGGQHPSGGAAQHNSSSGGYCYQES